MDNKIDKESLEQVLEEFTKKQKLLSKSVNDLVTAINSLTNKLTQFEENLAKQKEVAVSTNSKPIEEMTKKVPIKRVNFIKKLF